MDWIEAEGTLDVYHGHQGSAAKAHDGVHGIVHCGVAEWEIGVVDAIVDAASWWCIIRCHFPDLFLRGGTKGVDNKVRERGGGKGPIVCPAWYSASK